MKNVLNVFMVAIFALAMVACKKDNEFVNNSNLTNNKSPEIVNLDNSTNTSQRKCASKAYMEEKLQDPVYRAQHEKSVANFERSLLQQTAKSRSACSSPTILTVAVHYQGVSNADEACLVAAAKQAVEVLNADFQGKNSDIVQWDNNASTYYPNITNGDACIGFEIASKNHPAGFELNDGDLAITINKTSSDFSAKWSGYINIFVGDADGSLGYAPLGGSGNGDGVMIAQNAFTIGTSCGSVQGNSPNDLGRTLTHEIGHYLNLDHLWGDGGCNSDDQVNDTPNQADANYGCPSLGNTKGCSGEALHMNFMDYADDACMYMFSAGQATRMEAWTSSALNALKTNVLGGGTGGGNTGGGTGGGSTSDISTIKIKVILDNYGSETTFGIEDENGEEIAFYGPFQDGQEGKVITRKVDLPRGAYTFVIYDDYGDGICCYEGRGKWRLFKDGVKIKSSNGKFGYWEEYDFAVGSARLKAPAHRIDAQDEVTISKKTRVVVK